MSAAFVTTAGTALREVLSTALMISGPFLGVLLVVGVVVGLAQSASGVRDRAIGVVPRLVVGLALLSLMGSWIGGRVGTLMANALGAVAGAGRSSDAPRR